MNDLKASGVVFAALVVLGVTATSAFATLPDLSALTYPLHLNFADNGTTPTTFETTAATPHGAGRFCSRDGLLASPRQLGPYVLPVLPREPAAGISPPRSETPSAKSRAAAHASRDTG
jgi:hypothetical protein